MATATLNFNYRGTGNKFLNLPKLAEAAFTAIISRSAVRRVAATPYSIPDKAKTPQLSERAKRRSREA